MIKGTKFIILFIIITSGANVFSQHLSHQVLVPAAGLASNGAIFYSQSVGETAVEIVGCSGYVLTQGFQQPLIRLNPESPPEGSGVEVYPNPTTDFINVELYGDVARAFRIYVINITGTIACTHKISFGSRFWQIEPVDMTWLNKGLYFVRIVSEDGVINRTFKIEKM